MVDPHHSEVLAPCVEELQSQVAGAHAGEVTQTTYGEGAAQSLRRLVVVNLDEHIVAENHRLRTRRSRNPFGIPVVDQEPAGDDTHAPGPGQHPIQREGIGGWLSNDRNLHHRTLREPSRRTEDAAPHT